ncbi:MAG: hypothetical protein HQK49_21120 [Oligoflexia bacterium]|nr:hypothetical protein [Oligoflexia bacterium]
MFDRFLNKPKQSFFLFGPRGTGKSTWVNMIFKNALSINLLKPRELIDHTANPELLVKVKCHALFVSHSQIFNQ